MKWLLIITGMLAVIAGCGRNEDFSMNDDQIVCNMRREAFVAKPAAARFTELVRSSSADPLCAGFKGEKAS